jgi:hypothetical protein
MSKVAGRRVRVSPLQRHRGGWAIATLCAGALSTQSASAQEDPNAAETAAARVIALDGIKLADSGRCAEALEKLARAEKLHHALVVLGRLGECQVAQGKLVEGTENLRRVLREPLAANGSSVLMKARERAQGVLDVAKPRIGALNIAVKGPRDNSGVTVTVDGQPMLVALLDADRPTDPGEHLVEANAVGFLRGSARVNVPAGEKQSVVIKLETDPNAPVAGSSVGAPPEAPGAAPRTSTTAEPSTSVALDASSGATRGEPDRTGAYIAWAAGGAAVVAGSVFGLMAFKGKGDLDGQCSDNVCPETSQDRLDSAKRASTLSTVLFAVGGAGLGLGTVLFFTASPSASATAGHASTTHSPPRGFIGLGQVGLRGEF